MNSRQLMKQVAWTAAIAASIGLGAGRAQAQATQTAQTPPAQVPPAAAAPASAANALPLTMEQAVTMALESNLGLKSERLNLDIAAHSIALARSAFLPAV